MKFAFVFAVLLLIAAFLQQRIKTTAWYKYSFTPGWHRRRDNFFHWLARRLPYRLLYWSVIHASSKTMPGNAHPDSYRVPEILQGLQKLQTA